MQVTLDAVDWGWLTSYGSAGDFFDWYFDQEDLSGLPIVSCYDDAWSDSAMIYFEVAAALEHVAAKDNADLADHIRNGIGLLIRENGHIDEFGTAEATDHSVWMSLSPDPVIRIKSHLDSTDIHQVVAILKNDPAPDAYEVSRDLEGLFLPMIEDHRRMVEIAVSKGFGLLGSIG